jgi:hypothetical protein
VTKLLRRQWPQTWIVWRGDSCYSRVEAMRWAELGVRDFRERLVKIDERWTLLARDFE